MWESSRRIARTCDAEACLYASANALPKTRAPVKTTWVIMRWACEELEMVRRAVMMERTDHDARMEKECMR